MVQLVAEDQAHAGLERKAHQFEGIIDATRRYFPHEQRPLPPEEA
jgi:hypothetical protein